MAFDNYIRNGLQQYFFICKQGSFHMCLECNAVSKYACRVNYYATLKAIVLCQHLSWNKIYTGNLKKNNRYTHTSLVSRCDLTLSPLPK